MLINVLILKRLTEDAFYFKKKLILLLRVNLSFKPSIKWQITKKKYRFKV